VRDLAGVDRTRSAPIAPLLTGPAVDEAAASEEASNSAVDLAAARPAACFSGRVVDVTHQPIEGAAAFVIATSETLQAMGLEAQVNAALVDAAPWAQTDHDGRFRIETWQVSDPRALHSFVPAFVVPEIVATAAGWTPGTHN